MGLLDGLVPCLMLESGQMLPTAQRKQLSTDVRSFAVRCATIIEAVAHLCVAPWISFSEGAFFGQLTHHTGSHRDVVPFKSMSDFDCIIFGAPCRPLVINF